MGTRTGPLTLVIAIAAACGGGARRPPAAPPEVAARATPTRGPAPGREVVFRGACDASGAVPLSDRLVLIADDEDNVLRLYDADTGGPPRAGTDVSGALRLPLHGKKHPRPAELDLEAATQLGDRAYWLTSHARDKKGRPAPARLHLFATTLGETPRLVGHPYDRLIQDLAAAPELARFGLAAAAARSPEAAGGLNIEGMTAAPDGRVLLAFRNPIPGGRALVVPLLDVGALVDHPDAGPARFGPPVLLDLGGRGVRALSWWRGRYLILAGHHAGVRASALYTWDGAGRPAAITGIDLTGYNPEAFFTPEDRDEIMLVSDDGTVPIDGKPCKKLDDPARRRFRGLWLALP